MNSQMSDQETTDTDTDQLDNNTGSSRRGQGDGSNDTPEKKPNPMRCPFAPRTETMIQNLSRNTKRTQRYRSTAQSRLGDMTVGDIRYCFQQLRNAGEDLTPELILYNGQCAGEFALQYLQETSSAKKRRKPPSSTSEEASGNTRKNQKRRGPMEMQFPSSQLGDDDGSRHKRDRKNVLEF